MGSSRCNGAGIRTATTTSQTDPGSEASHQNYVSHHNGAQYFGYIANNPAEQTNLRGEGDFFSDMAKNVLPRSGGVFYIRGGYYNLKYPNDSAIIQNPNYPNKNGFTRTELAAIRTAKSGDDDHPSYSDSQLTEAMAARVINAIAANKDVWEHSAIVITYDQSDGLYDHVPPRILSYGPDGLPIARGIRIPLLLISPYAHVHAVSHAEGDHNAVIETINALFGLPALSSLPDEKEALAQGIAKFNAFAPPGFEQKYLGPRDNESPTTASLLSGFDKARITGALPPLPGSYAMIPDADIFFSTLWRQGMRGDRDHARGRAPEYPERDSRGVQSSARDAAGVQLSLCACQRHTLEHPSRRDASRRSAG